MKNQLVLTFDGVAVGYDRHPVLENLDFTLPRGRFVGLLGANGSGKSTILKTILGILPPLAGRMTFHPIEGRRPVLGYMPQRESLDPIFLLTSFEVVLMAACSRIGPGRSIPKAEREWARECLGETGAPDLAHKLFSQLSGGQKQRVLMARALATRPDFLLLDEPIAGIDAAASQAIMDLLRRLHQGQKRTLLFVSHDLTTVRHYAEEVIWLHEGRILHGAAHELLSREKIEEVLHLESG
jgi:ABC-type Mn2+/Zn2+ transport system ATPase subunit